eukprot:SAG31_NODE_2054_length_6549_cov_33.997830_5_plen_68_part_00
MNHGNECGAARIDVGAAAAHGIAVVDTTQGTSYPVAEWALALVRNALERAPDELSIAFVPCFIVCHF